MCLHFTRKIVEDFKLKNQTESIVGYKVLSNYKGLGLFSLYYSHQWEVGINKADTVWIDKVANSKDILRVSNSIHVYLNRSDAEKFSNSLYKVVEVICRMEHLIAVGDKNVDTIDSCKEACFSQVELTQKELDRVV